MAEVVAMTNGHRTLPVPTLTSAQVPHNFLKLLLHVEEAPRVSAATNSLSFGRRQDHQQQQQPQPQQSAPSQHNNLSHPHHHHPSSLHQHHPPQQPQQQQQPTPSSSAEQPSKRSGPMDAERWGDIDPHLGKDAELLRKQLLSAISGEDALQQATPVSSQQPPISSPTMAQRGDIRPSSSLSPGSGGEDSHKADSRQKRELNTSKRAAQNRNAQRAFRARKEEYIKSLESKVRDYEAVEERNQALETENAALRQYIMHLQRRLLDHLGEGEALPDPPAGLNIEALHISSRPNSSKISMKPELPPFAAFHHDKTLPDPVAGVKRARVDE
ncbi:hypothetical protein DRE_06529 [Drechslerella stenobrocha 248]|uniref:Putative transcription factor kapC n=1 Tax=Drechslerella stenobrocha 248 TaxID=1043628 RepID=W7HL88_9PEZI|nr:hypothetical protein DRE_06529 [Drechslerella stenobrocha 248]